jgi:hypothetical protein
MNFYFYYVVQLIRPIPESSSCSLLSKFLAKQPQTDLAASDLQPYVTKWDEEEEEFSRKFDFKLAVLAN